MNFLDLAARNVAAHRGSMPHARQCDVVNVARVPRHLADSFLAKGWRAYDTGLRRVAHDGSKNDNCLARTLQANESKEYSHGKSRLSKACKATLKHRCYQHGVGDIVSLDLLHAV
jgi:hypothetical protein